MSDQQLQSRAPYAISEPRLTVSGQMVTTAFEIPGFRVKQNLGVVRGIVVRSRNVFVNIGAVFNQLVGGNITAWSNLCETARRDEKVSIAHPYAIAMEGIRRKYGLERLVELVGKKTVAIASTPSLCIHCNRCMPTIYTGTRCPEIA